MATAKKIPGPASLLMPKATAVWMIENTVLTFHQIAEFTGLTEIEIEALANEDIGKGMVGRNPVEHKELTAEELEKAQADANYRMRQAKTDLPQVKIRARGPRYTPVSKRGDKPDAIAYILKNNPEIRDAQICKLVGTTKPTINAVRDRTHPAAATLRPRHPVELMLCTYQEYEKAVNKGLKAAGKDPEKVKAERAAKLEASRQQPEETEKPFTSGGFDFSNFLTSSKPTTSETENQ